MRWFLTYVAAPVLLVLVLTAWITYVAPPEPSGPPVIDEAP